MILYHGNELTQTKKHNNFDSPGAGHREIKNHHKKFQIIESEMISESMGKRNQKKNIEQKTHLKQVLWGSGKINNFKKLMFQTFLAK